MTKRRIREWYEYWDGDVYVSFSGGKDSTVLLDIVRQIYPDVPAVFVDTGLEYPEIRQFVKTFDNVIWLKPKMNFKEVINKYGYPVVSKEVSETIDQCRKGYKSRFKKLDPNNKDGYTCANWAFLMDAPFKISNLCCNAMKKSPVKSFEKKSNLKPFIGTRASESQLRKTSYLREGCNGFNATRKISQPIAFWKEEDIWEYIKTNNLPYSEIYDKGMKRTGCMFCMFGVHHDKFPNRFQQMAKTHPKQYRYCIENLGLGEVLDYISVPYKVYENGIMGEINKDTEGNKYEQLKF